MRAPLTPIKAFVHDASKLGTTGGVSAVDDPRLCQWLRVAQAAERLAKLAPGPRMEYLQTLGASVLPSRDGRPTQTEGDGRQPTDAWSELSERLRMEAEDMESAGCFELARTTVSFACQLVARAPLPSLLLATAHLGRVNRQTGDLNSASDCYTTVTARGTAAGDLPIAAHGFIGLGNVAHARGNRPAQQNYYERALELSVKGSPVELSAHQGLMITANQRGHLADALLHGWRAHDLAPPNSEVQLEIVGNLAGIALEAGFFEASLNGYEYVAHTSTVSRNRLPSLGGAIRAAAKSGNRPAVESIEARAQVEMQCAALPFDIARFCLWSAESWHILQEHIRVAPLLDEALELAQQYGFYEVRMRAESLLSADMDAADVAAESTFTVDQDNPIVQAGIGRLYALSPA